MKLLEKFINILISNIYSLIVTFCISVSLLLTYIFCWHNSVVLCLFFFFVVPCVLNFIHSTYKFIINAINNRKAKKEWLFELYLNLDKKERDIFYNLFYEDSYKVLRDPITFYMNEGSPSRSKTFMRLTYYAQPGDIFVEENKDKFPIICNISDVYTDDTSPFGCRGFNSYIFTMRSDFKKTYRKYLKCIKAKVEKLDE